MNEEAAKIWNKLAEIKDNTDAHVITREESQEQAAPLIARINERTTEIAKKYGKKPILLTYITAMRSPLLNLSVGETKARYGNHNA